MALANLYSLCEMEELWIKYLRKKKESTQLIAWPLFFANSENDFEFNGILSTEDIDSLSYALYLLSKWLLIIKSFAVQFALRCQLVPYFSLHVWFMWKMLTSLDHIRSFHANTSVPNHAKDIKLGQFWVVFFMSGE